MRTHALSLEALEHALNTATTGIADLVHHCDRGSQYVAIAYTERLAAAGISPSVRTVGDSYDNALAQTANGLYKAELIYSQPACSSLTDVEFATMNWVHWWNTTRLHEALGYQTPAQVEARYAESLTHREPSLTTI